jgi:putative oxidoreductase
MAIFENVANKTTDTFYVIFRVLVGVIFALHAAQKFGWIVIGQPLTVSGFAGFYHIPVWLAFIVAIVELAGGIFIALGLLTRLALVAMIVDMVCALIIGHFPKGIIPLNNGEPAWLYLAAFLVIFAFGARRWALDNAIFGKEVF